VEFITRRLEDLGYAVEHHHVATLDADGQPFVVTNVAADLSGGHAGESPLILCAHYDSRVEGEEDVAPGADDNASGVAVLLEAARIFAEAGVEPHVTLVFFGGEEDSLIGSRAFADKISRERPPLRGVVNVDMVGYDEYGSLDIVVFTNPHSMPLAAEVAGVARRRTRLVTATTVAATGNSDHASFWRVGQQAVSIWEGYDHNPYHATSKDVPAVLTPHFMVEVARLIVSVAVEIGGTSDPLPRRWPRTKE
jgi:Zn-dependent M28 family amino/carboxypeptidase